MSAGWRSPLLDWPGAVPAQSPDEGVAAHYGDPLAEQRRLAGGDGWVDLSHYDVAWVSGPDRLSWLHNLTSQRLAGLPVGESAEALVLSPNGHVEHHLQLVDDGQASWVCLQPFGAAGLVAFLDSMRFMLQVDVADVSEQWALVWEPTHVRRTAGLSWVDPVEDAAAGRLSFVPRAELSAFVGQLAGQPCGVQALEALRVAAGRPRFGVDTDERTIPHETGWVGRAVQLDKGCYRGQETVARVANLGRPPRRLVRLLLDGTQERLPIAGTSVTVDGVDVGRVTSSAQHFELGPIALALVKYDTADDAQAVVNVEGAPVAARLEPIVVRDDTPRPGQAARAAFRAR